MIGDLLQQTSGLKSLLQQSRDQSRLLDRIQQLLPPPLQPHCRAAVLKQGQLLLYTDASAWASRLRYLSRELITQLKKHGLSVSKVTVRVMLGNRPLPVASRPGRKLTADNARLLQQTAASIDDAELSAALARLSRHTRST